MKPGLYEARSLICDRVAYVVLDDAAQLRLRLHRARAALRLVRWHVDGSMGVVVARALRDMGED